MKKLLVIMFCSLLFAGNIYADTAQDLVDKGAARYNAEHGAANQAADAQRAAQQAPSPEQPHN